MKKKNSNKQQQQKQIKELIVSDSEVPPRFELGSLDSKSRVLTITPWDLWQGGEGQNKRSYSAPVAPALPSDPLRIVLRNGRSRTYLKDFFD